MCKLLVSEEPHLWPLLQTELIIMGGDGETSESCLFPASWPGRSRLEVEGRSPAPRLGGVATGSV